MHKLLFYKTENGNDIVLDWIRSLDSKDRKIIGEDLKAVQLGFPLGLPLCRSLGGGLWEVRSSLSSKREARLLFGHLSKQAALLVTAGFIKKTQKTPNDILDLARKRLREFQS